MFLSSREVKSIKKIVESQFGYCPKLDYFFEQRDEKVFLLNKESQELNQDGMRINNQGLYFGRLTHGELKLSIEGSQMVGPKATKNVLELTDDEVRMWLQGLDLDNKGQEKRFVIIKHKNDYFGCGREIEGRLLNLVPKARRIRRL